MRFASLTNVSKKFVVPCRLDGPGPVDLSVGGLRRWGLPGIEQPAGIPGWIFRRAVSGGAPARRKAVGKPMLPCAYGNCREENGSKKGELPFAVTDRVLECSRTVVVSLSEH